MTTTTTLEELFSLAQQYGNVHLYQSSTDRTFQVDIKFMTIQHTTLKAESPYKCPTIQDALIKAIKVAEDIVRDTDKWRNIPRLK